MSIEILKKDLKKKGIRNSLIIFALAIIFTGSYIFSSSSDDELAAIQSEISTLSSKITKKKSEYAESEANLKAYLAIDKIKLPSENGFSLGRDRLKVALPKVQELKDIYVFKKLNFSLTEIKENNQIRSGVFSVFENTINIDYAGATDEYILSFISDLKNKLPGYITVKGLTINKDQDITIASAVDYLSTSGTAFVSGKMELTWSTLKLKPSFTKPKVVKK